MPKHHHGAVRGTAPKPGPGGKFSPTTECGCHRIKGRLRFALSYSPQFWCRAGAATPSSGPRALLTGNRTQAALSHSWTPVSKHSGAEAGRRGSACCPVLGNRSHGQSRRTIDRWVNIGIAIFSLVAKLGGYTGPKFRSVPAIEEVWRRTQFPIYTSSGISLTQLTTFRRRSKEEPQRFRYSTRLALTQDHGEGESTGTREDAAGLRTSGPENSGPRDPKSV